MNLVRLDPWSVFDQMQRELNPGPVTDYVARRGASAVGDWVPAVDIVEYKDRFSVRADVPGVDPAAIDVSMDNGVLSIGGERAPGDRSDIDGIQRYERVAGRFLRRFSLPDTADADNVSARCRNGILEITIAKLPEIRARRITVEAA